MSFKEILVLLVDDHHIFRDGIQSLFAGIKTIRIMDVAASGNDAVEKYKLLKPDIVLLDISLPDISGFAVAERIIEFDNTAKIILLTMHENPDFIKKAIKSGIRGYLSKEDTSRDVLVKAIYAIYNNETFFSESVEKKLGEISIPHISNDLSENTLSKREIEILKLILEGLSNPEIAQKLYLSVRTVETHKFNIMAKLNIKSTVELVKYAIQNNLIELK